MNSTPESPADGGQTPSPIFILLFDGPPGFDAANLTAGIRAVEPLKQLAQSGQAIGRLHALWTLQGLNALEASLVERALTEEVKISQLNGELAAIEAKKADREHKLAELAAKQAKARSEPDWRYPTAWQARSTRVLSRNKPIQD